MIAEVIVGVLIFTLAQAFLKFVLEPLQAHKKVIGDIAFALIFYSNVGGSAPKEEQTETTKHLRSLASELRRGLEIIPFYILWDKLNILPSKSSIYKASTSLVGWSNSVTSSTFAIHRDTIAEALEIDWSGKSITVVRKQGVFRRFILSTLVVLSGIIIGVNLFGYLTLQLCNIP